MKDEDRQGAWREAKPFCHLQGCPWPACGCRYEPPDIRTKEMTNEELSDAIKALQKAFGKE